MRSDEAARRAAPGRSIRTPDQLQQARRPDPPGPRAPEPPPRAPAEEAPPNEGVLGQLETERAHD